MGDEFQRKKQQFSRKPNGWESHVPFCFQKNRQGEGCSKLWWGGGGGTHWLGATRGRAKNPGPGGQPNTLRNLKGPDPQPPTRCGTCDNTCGVNCTEHGGDFHRASHIFSNEGKGRGTVLTKLVPPPAKPFADCKFFKPLGENETVC